MKRLLPIIRPAWLVVALALQAGLVAGEEKALEIRVVRNGWGDAPEENIERVLRSAASQLREFCPRPLNPIVVKHAEGSPIVLYRKGAKGETLVHLNVTGTHWAQFAYQFAHEFCHICCGYEKKAGRNNQNQWFEESLCETASLFAMRRMAVAWKTNPPYPNWRSFAKHLDSYTADILANDKRKLPAHTTFTQWFALNESKLRENGGCDRDRNGVIANNVLLPLLEKHPENWEAIAYLNVEPPSEPAGFAQYLAAWRRAAPEKHRAFIQQIAETFGVQPR